MDSLKQHLESLAISLERRAGYSACGAFEELKQAELVKTIVKNLPLSSVGATTKQTGQPSSSMENAKASESGQSSAMQDNSKAPESGQSSAIQDNSKAPDTAVELIHQDQPATGASAKRRYEETPVPSCFTAKRILDKDLKGGKLHDACRIIGANWEVMPDQEKETWIEKESKRVHKDDV